jgi:hypothetical protein
MCTATPSSTGTCQALPSTSNNARDVSIPTRACDPPQRRDAVHGQDGVADGDDGPAFTAAAGDALVALGQERVGAGSAGDDLADRSAGPRVALAGGGGFLLACGVLIDGREPGPRHQVGSVGEAGHAGADLGDQLLRAGPADAGDLVEPSGRAGGRGDLLLDPGGQLGGLPGEVVDTVQHHPAEVRMVVIESAGESLLQHYELDAHPADGQLRKGPRVASLSVMASSMARPDIPRMSLTTADSLTLGVLQELPGPLPLRSRRRRPRRPRHSSAPARTSGPSPAEGPGSPGLGARAASRTCRYWVLRSSRDFATVSTDVWRTGVRAVRTVGTHR